MAYPKVCGVVQCRSAYACAVSYLSWCADDEEVQRCTFFVKPFGSYKTFLLVFGVWREKVFDEQSWVFGEFRSKRTNSGETHR